MNETLTRCLNCLRLSQTSNGQCVFDDCQAIPRTVTEDKARFLMTCHGYRIAYGYLWLVGNDDPDDFQETIIGSWHGSWADGFRALIRHGMPTTPNIICGSCKTDEVEFLGDDCYACAREANEWEKVGEVR